ncbi:preprotein translocase subunit SecY [Bowdeniella nasicola]|uniref:Protein translocase subunit SecY n=1 Tax=Bowdeniella nasicola TaxID=208480 RepID=A0A1Q5Q5G7_9ACTO|nr:preprotein translocase subunit SecY [Bowdeniella nasicola]OKL55065.1 preprotein translocase subunit SecY [Bowdeniella nasicola]
MLSAFAHAFRVTDLRKKLLFTLAIMAIYRFGSFVPAPGVDYGNVQQCVAGSQNSFLGMINLFSGGGLLQLSVFALGIMPYITASIIIQLMRVVIPRFEDLHKEGQAGQAKLTQYTRYLTIFLGVLQSTVMVTTAANGLLFQGCPVNPIPNAGPASLLLTILTMTAGTGLIMWLGELISEKGIGNGMSLLIFTSIAASFPIGLGTVFGLENGIVKLLVILAVILIITLAVVFVEQCQRRIPVQYAKRMVGRRLYGGSSTYIPMKINLAGVIPVIFASSIMQLPVMISEFNKTAPWAVTLAQYFSPSHPLRLTVYTLLIIFFAFFYTSITFNPEEVADNMKRYGGFIPGIRAGRPTAEYLNYVMTRITAPGALYLAIVALVPEILFAMMGLNQAMPWGGTSIMIMVGVALQTVKDIDSQLQQRHYEGFLS